MYYAMRKLFKTSFMIFAAVVMAAGMFMGCDKKEEPTPSGGNGGNGGNDGPKTVAVTGVSLSKSSLSLVEGNSESLTATVAPDNATNKAVSWKSSDAAIATVDNSGKVTAVKAGSATITVTTTDGSKTATCSVTVTAKEIVLNEIVVDPATKEVKEGETFELTVKFLPAGALEKSVSWRSTNPEVATVEGGTVTTLKAGKTKLFARVDGTEIEASCDLTVTQDPTLRGIAFTSDRFGVSIGDPKKLELIFTPDYADNKVVTFSSSDPSVATVNADGIVNGLSQGETTITAKSMEGGFEATCKVIVTNYGLSSLYWTQNNGLMLGGVDTGIRTIFTPGVDPEGNVYYAHYDNYGHPAVNKNGTDIYTITNSNWTQGVKSTAGGGYFFVPLELDYRKNLSVMRISDDGEEKVFSIHEGKATFEYEVHDVSADSKGNLYVAGEIKDEYGLWVGIMWTLTVDGKVSKTTFGDGSRDTSCYSVATVGSDVWCLVWEGRSNNGKNILAAYKNGKRQYQLCDDVCQRGGRPCEIGIAGNDVYAVVNYDFEHNNKTSRIEVFKNGELLYTPIVHEYVYLYSFFVTPDGDTYVSGYRDTDSGSYNYIWRNDTHIFSPTVIASDLFVKK